MLSVHETTISVESLTRKSRKASQVKKRNRWFPGSPFILSMMLIQYEYVLSSRTREKQAGHVLATWDVKSVVSETEIIPIILNGKLHVFARQIAVFEFHLLRWISHEFSSPSTLAFIFFINLISRIKRFSTMFKNTLLN